MVQQAGPDRGRVLAVAQRCTGQAPLQDAGQLLALGGQGLFDDVHADPLSPRQLLLAGAPAYARHGLAAHALRENLLLDMDTAGLRSGMVLQVGTDALLWLTFQCEACGQLDAIAPGLARRIGPQRGMLARVLRGGIIRPGDAVSMLPGGLPPWSDDWRQRAVAVLAAVPDGMVLEYRQLARLIGVQSSYCRALPRLARAAGLGGKAVTLQDRSSAPRWQGRELFGASAGA
ncbi:hypothetical protein ASD15_24685 [Massilia sp. Root351]|jgi:hypothetical protein|nr:hypothetical protein ASD15_24685 [Massilia sp. Root351]